MEPPPSAEVAEAQGTGADGGGPGGEKQAGPRLRERPRRRSESLQLRGGKARRTALGVARAGKRTRPSPATVLCACVQARITTRVPVTACWNLGSIGNCSPEFSGPGSAVLRLRPHPGRRGNGGGGGAERVVLPLNYNSQQAL